MTTLELFVIFITAWTFIYLKLSPVAWSSAMTTVLLLATIYCGFEFWLIFLLWFIFAIVAVFTIVKPLRMICFTIPFLKQFRKMLPPMSNTEREALEAGDVWWEGDLFSGRPNWWKLHAIPQPTLSQEENDFIHNETEQLCQMLDDWQIVQHDRDLTPATWSFLKANGFFGLVIDKKYGGKGFSAFAHSTIVCKIATRSMSAAVTAMVPNSLGPGELLAHYGTEAQKQHYLPRLAKGEEVPCFALTSLESGSDAGAMRDFGVVCHGDYQGETVLGIKLTWNKRYITLAPIATVLGLAFKLFDPDHLLGDQEVIGITLALLPTNHPGVEIGKRHFPMGLAFMNGPTSGKDVFIPMDWIIGGASMAGKGWSMLMECLSIGRSISLPALGAAMGNLTYYSSSVYSELRKQFKVPLAKFEGVQEALAKIAGNCYLLEASRQMTAGAVDLKVNPSVVSAIQKYHATELARVMCDAAMDIHAGRGIQLGPRNYLGQASVSLPISITVEGANILTRNLIIFGQGAIRCHPYVLQEMLAAADKNQKRAEKKFDGLLLSHIGYTASNIVRAITFGLTNAITVRSPKLTGFTRYYRQLTRMSTALALCTDFAMLSLGGELKRKERLSARLGDMLSYLYLASCAIKYYVDQQQQTEDCDYLVWCLETALFKIQTACIGFLKNFPNRFIAIMLRMMIFPLGLPYRAPSDALESKMVHTMVNSNVVRDRLCSNLFIADDKDDCLGRIDAAFKAKSACKAIRRKIKKAINENKISYDANVQLQTALAVEAKIITQKEAEQVILAEQLIADAMEVDAFTNEYLTKTTSPTRN